MTNAKIEHSGGCIGGADKSVTSHNNARVSLFSSHNRLCRIEIFFGGVWLRGIYRKGESGTVKKEELQAEFGNIIFFSFVISFPQ